jgi:hypothetical protein
MPQLKNSEALKDRLSRVRPKDTTLNNVQRRGLEPVAESGYKPTEPEPRQEKERDIAPIERLKKAQREFVKVAGKFDLDRNCSWGEVATRDGVRRRGNFKKAQLRCARPNVRASRVR